MAELRAEKHCSRSLRNSSTCVWLNLSGMVSRMSSELPVGCESYPTLAAALVLTANDCALCAHILTVGDASTRYQRGVLFLAITSITFRMLKCLPLLRPAGGRGQPSIRLEARPSRSLHNQGRTMVETFGHHHSDQLVSLAFTRGRSFTARAV